MKTRAQSTTDKLKRLKTIEPVRGWSELHLAAKIGDCDLIESLVKQPHRDHKKHDINERTSDNVCDTALHCAVRHHQLEALKTLMKLGAKNLYNAEKEFPLHIAATLNDCEAIKIIGIKWKSDINIIARALPPFNNPSPELAAHFESQIAETALHTAARLGHLDAVKTLKPLGASHDIIDSRGNHPIDYAYPFPALLKFFVKEMGADPNKMVNRPVPGNNISAPCTLLHIAASLGLIESGRMLNKLGATHKENHYGNYPIYIATLRDQERFVEFLIDEMKVDINLKVGPLAGTALHSTVYAPSFKTAAFLISRNAQHNPDFYGRYPIHLAAQYNNPTLIRIFATTANFDINQTSNRSEYNALCEAVDNNAEKAVDALIELGAQPDTWTMRRLFDLNIFYKIYIKFHNHQNVLQFTNQPTFEESYMPRMIHCERDWRVRNLFLLCILSYHQNPKTVLDRFVPAFMDADYPLRNLVSRFRLASNDHQYLFMAIFKGSPEAFVTLTEQIKIYMTLKKTNFYEIIYIVQVMLQLKDIFLVRKDFGLPRVAKSINNVYLNFFADKNMITQPLNLFLSSRPAFNKKSSTASTPVEDLTRFFRRLNENESKPPSARAKNLTNFAISQFNPDKRVRI